MRLRSALHLFLLFLFCQTVHSAFLSNPLERPWNDPLWLAKNPNIYHTLGMNFLFSGIFSTSLENLELEKMNTFSDSKFQNLLKKSKSDRDTAVKLAEECSSLYSDIEAHPPDRLKYIFDETVSGLRSGYRSGRIAGRVIGGALGGQIDILNLGAMMGGNEGSVFGGISGALGGFFGALFSQTKDKRVVELGKICSQYGIKWRAAMDAAADIYDYSFDQLNKKWDEAGRGYSELVKAGICDNDYYSYGKATCETVREIYSSADYNITGKYGSHSLDIGLLNQRFRGGIQQNLPNTTLYYGLMNTIWNEKGAISEADYVQSIVRQTLNTADKFTLLFSKQVTEKQKDLKEKIVKLQKDESNKITEGNLLTGPITNEKQLSIKELYDDIKNSSKAIENDYSLGIAAYSDKNLGYLKNSIQHYTNAIKLYNTTNEKINLINEEMQEVISQKRDEAITILQNFEQDSHDKFISKKAAALYKKAKAELDDGEKKEIPGQKFELYSQAANDGRYARNKYDNISLDFAASMLASMANAKKFLDSAEKDGLSLEFEKQKIKYMETEQLEDPGILTDLKNMENAVLAQEKILYEPLENKRKLLLMQIESGKDITADLKTTMLDGEKDAFNADGTVNYEKAVGKFKELSKLYNSVDLELHRSRKDIVANALTKSSDTYFDRIMLDKPDNIKFQFVIGNNLGYSADKIQVAFDFPYRIEVLKSDIIRGGENVVDLVNKKDNIILFIRHIEPFSILIIEMNLSEILAKTTKQKLVAIGKSDGIASVTDERAFDLSVDAPIALGNNFEAKMKIDGNEYNNEKLKRGKHDLIAEYEIPDSYNINISDYNAETIGLKTKIRYDYLINSSIDLKTLTIYDDLNQGIIKNLDIIPLTGERLNNIKKSGNGFIFFDVQDLHAGNKAIIRVSYDLDNASEYIQNEFSLFNSYNLSDTSKNLFDQAKYALVNNDTEKSVALIIEIEKQIRKEQAEGQKLEINYKRLARTLENEKDTMADALLKTKDQNLTKILADGIELRISEINRTLANYPVPSNEAIEKLNLVEQSSKKIINDMRKKLFNDFNDLKEKILKLGIIDLPASFKETEDALTKARDTDDINYLIQAGQKLEEAKQDFLNKENQANSDAAGLKIKFGHIKENIMHYLDSYKKQAAIAKSGRFSYLFNIDTKLLYKNLNDIQKKLDNGNIADLTASLEDLGNNAKIMQETMQTLETESQNKLASLESKFDAAGLNMEQKNKISTKFNRIKELISKKDFINALNAIDIVSKDLGDLNKTDNTSFLLLGVTALLVISLLVAYMLKFNKKAEPPKLKVLKRIEE